MSNNKQAFRFNKKSIAAIAAGSAVATAIIVFLFMPSAVSPIETAIVEPQIENNPVVAEVNGQKVRLEEVKDFINIGSSQGQILDGATALDRVIIKTLLLEEAQERDIAVAISEATDDMTDMYTKNGLSLEQFKEKLSQIGVTYDQTLEMYREQMVINEMLAAEISKADIQVGDKEARAFFDDNIQAINTQIGNNTAFEDVSEQIKSMLVQQKQQQAIMDFIKDLKGNATIITYKDRL